MLADTQQTMLLNQLRCQVMVFNLFLYVLSIDEVLNYF
jgi:hypothetical protein